MIKRSTISGDASTENKLQQSRNEKTPSTILLLLLYERLKEVFSRCEDVVKDQNTRDHLARPAGNGDPMHEVCIPCMGIARVK